MLLNFTELIKKWDIRPTGILHCGASTGQEAQEYWANGVQRVFMIEPIPWIFNQLVDNLSIIPFFEKTLCNVCISEFDFKKSLLNVSSNNGESSSLLEFGLHSELHPDVTFIKKIEVECRRLDTLVGDHIDLYPFINFDVQGQELSVLRSMGHFLSRVKYAYLEVNKKEVYRGCALISEIDAYMEGFCFERVDIAAWIGEAWTDAFYINKNIYK